MKPKSGGRAVGDEMAAGHDEYDEISLDKAYETVGLLITESRIPDRSSKGRRDGEHIPQNLPTHKACSDSNDECRRVRRYREEMTSLCRNGIPLCVEVLLCPHCEMESVDRETITPDVHHTHEVGSAHSDSFVLLEQWTIQQVHARIDSKLQSLQNLCNAVRSHICFSQLSAWLQLSQGVTPKHIFYRLTAPGEWFVHKFVMSPQSHRFPDAALGKLRCALRVTLSSLPRTTLTPYEISIASRDKLFGVKDASPLLRKSRSSFNNLGTTGEDSVDRAEISRATTPNERTHVRSKSVRGLQDLPGRKSPSDSGSHSSPYGAQRRLKYSEDNQRSASDSLSAAEKLASFSTLPTNSINKLELISCATGKSLPKTAPPDRLSLSYQTSKSLKSPKVLFTRTSVRDNFFPVPSSFEGSQLPPDHRLDSDNEQISPKSKTLFDLGDSDISPPDKPYNRTRNHDISEHNLNEALAAIEHLPVDIASCPALENYKEGNLSGNIYHESLVTSSFKASSPDQSVSEAGHDLEHESATSRQLSSQAETQHDLTSGARHDLTSEARHDLISGARRDSTSSDGDSASNGTDNSHSSNGTVVDRASSGTDGSRSSNGTMGSRSSNGTLGSRSSNGTDGSHSSNGTDGSRSSNGTDGSHSSNGTDIKHSINKMVDKARFHKELSAQSTPTTDSDANALIIHKIDDGELDKRRGVQSADACVNTRKSRRHLAQEHGGSLHEKGQQQISDTPINKNLQHIKQPPSHPQAHRSRLFRQRPLQSSPAPVKRIGRSDFGYDAGINSIEAIKSAISCTSLSDHNSRQTEREKSKLTLSSSAPAFTTANRATQGALQSRSSLLGNFEESLLNGRIDPAGVVDGFTVDIGASGAFCPKHVILPVEAYFFNSLSDDDASSPYLGYVDLSQVSRRGYQIPRKGTVQITLFYPNHKVNKMFVVTYDLSDMPAKSQTFIRQKTVYAPCEEQAQIGTALALQYSSTPNSDGKLKLPTYLRYLIHLRFLSTKTNKIFLHTDVRLIYARDKFEFDSRVASYELRSFIESPSDPKYSPLR